MEIDFYGALEVLSDITKFLILIMLFRQKKQIKELMKMEDTVILLKERMDTVEDKTIFIESEYVGKGEK